MTQFGMPTNFPFLQSSVDSEVSMQAGGFCLRAKAAEALKMGDAVCWSLGGRLIKSVEMSLYLSRFAGIVVGGTLTGMEASDDSSLVGTQVSAAGEDVIIMVRGICYAACDVTNGVVINQPILPGTTTAGEIRTPFSSFSGSYAINNPALAIKAGGSALVKATNVVQQVVNGVWGTATAANLDMAALSGTTAADKFAVYVFRVASDGTTVTSAKSADADSLAQLLWPTGSGTLCTLGGVIINPTGTGDFVGGTTALDDATVVPNAVYFNLTKVRENLGIALEAGAAAGDPVKVLIQ